MIRTLLVDGNFALKRAYHANDVNSKYNVHSLKVAYSLVTAIRNIVKQVAPHKVVMFWDAPNGGIYRYHDYPEYKANRAGKDWSKKMLTEEEAVLVNEENTNLDSHKGFSSSIFQHLHVRQCEVDGHEADDLMALYCKKYGHEENIYLFTNDDDVLQCSEIGAKMLIGRQVVRSETEGVSYIPQDSKGCARLLGYPPRNIAVVKAFCGDPSDNIKGARGCSVAKLGEVVDLQKPLTIQEVYEAVEKSHSKEPLQWKANLLLGITNDVYRELDDIIVEKGQGDRFVNILGEGFETDLKIQQKTWDSLSIYKYIVKISKNLEMARRIFTFVKERRSLKLCDYELNHRLTDLIDNHYVTDEGVEEVELMGEACLDVEGIGAKQLMQDFAKTDFLLEYRFIRMEDRDYRNKAFRNIFIEYCRPFMDSCIKWEKEYHNKHCST